VTDGPIPDNFRSALRVPFGLARAAERVGTCPCLCRVGAGVLELLDLSAQVLVLVLVSFANSRIIIRPLLTFQCTGRITLGFGVRCPL
jgi:hypothetical protein